MAIKLLEFKELSEHFARAYHAERSDRDNRIANRAFTQRLMSLVESKKATLEDFSIKEMWEMLVLAPSYSTGVPLEEMIHSSAFPTITGEILSRAMIEGYNEFPTDANSLVRVEPSNRKVETSAGWTPIGGVSKVKEKGDYPEVDFADEKVVLTENNKYGGIVSLTRESIKFDQTQKLIGKARDIGREGARKRSQLILEGVIDKDSNVFNKAQLYTVGNANLLTGAGSVLGNAGFEASELALMNKKDEKNNPIWVLGTMPTIMVPTALKALAWKLKNNEYGPNGTALGNDKNYAQNAFNIVVNPYQTNTTRWHHGDFKSQFVWFEVWPVETAYRTGQDHEDGFVKDIIVQAKVSFMGGVGALDNKYVMQNNGQ